MLIERQASKNKQIFLIVLILIVNGIVGYMVYNNFGPKRTVVKPEELTRTETPAKVGESIAAIETLTQDFDRTLLDSEEFRALEKYGVWPVEGSATGHLNPFLPAFGPQ